MRRSISITAKKASYFQKGEASELMPTGSICDATASTHQMPVLQVSKKMWFYVRNERQCCWFVLPEEEKANNRRRVFLCCIKSRGGLNHVRGMFPNSIIHRDILPTRFRSPSASLHSFVRFVRCN